MRGDEDRDPAQREAEGPKSSMDFFISTKKNPDRARTVLGPYASRIALYLKFFFHFMYN